MRFISMHRADANTEADVPPGPELIAGMMALTGDMQKAGAFESGEGLRASSRGVRLQYKDGARSITRGPLKPGNELPAGITLVKVADIEAAMAWADRHAQVFGDVEIDVRPLCEPWHLDLCPAPPPGSPERFMLQIKADARSESGAPLGAARAAALRQLHADMQQAGVFAGAEGIRPSSEGLRVIYARHGAEQRVIDGPFAESKELIAGYCIMRVASRAEALVWMARFAANFNSIEADLRPLYEPADLA